MCDDHPWTLTAPWWAWTKAGTAGPAPRATAPLLQKYDRSDPVSGFVKEPQRRLSFLAEDVVQRAVAYPAAPGKKPRMSDWFLVPDPAGTRKLFLPSHKRFYLVVAELHCDTAGLPTVNRDKVCEAGFVVRRRRLSFAPEHAAAAGELVAKIGALSAQVAALDRGGAARLLKKRARQTRGGVIGAMANALSKAPPAGRVAEAVAAKDVERRKALQDQLVAARADLLRWKAASGAVSVAEGWIADPHAENVGAWAPVDDRPAALEEVVHRLSPLVADPREPGHDAAGKTIWFGMIPGGSREVDATGAARFDDETRYEVRCFVRRHACDCPKTGEPNDCGGELVWSAPTAPFQLAAHFDPVGTGNHPITIQMPDIPTLAASVGARLPVAMKFPSDSALNIQGDKEGTPSNPTTNAGFPQICFFSIPLITIIATFVLNLFLPVVVFLFGLWFLLGLKFCIPPSISFSAGAAAHVGLEGKIGAALAVDVDINADLTLAGNLGADFNLLAMGDRGAIEIPVASGNFQPIAGTPGHEMIQERENTAVNELREDMSEDHTAEVEAVDLTVLPWEPRVERWMVGA